MLLPSLRNALNSSPPCRLNVLQNFTRRRITTKYENQILCSNSLACHHLIPRHCSLLPRKTKACRRHRTTSDLYSSYKSRQRSYQTITSTSTITQNGRLRRNNTMDTQELVHFLADSPPSCVRLEIAPHFKALSDQQKRYAHYISRYVSVRICLLGLC